MDLPASTSTADVDSGIGVINLPAVFFIGEVFFFAGHRCVIFCVNDESPCHSADSNQPLSLESTTVCLWANVLVNNAVFLSIVRVLEDVQLLEQNTISFLIGQAAQ